MTLARLSRGAGALALLVVGALILHELRYLLAFGPESAAVQARTGHGYLELVLPIVAAAAAAALIIGVVGPALDRRSRAAGSGCPTERAAGYAVALLAVHLTQELAEGLLAGGHSASLAGVLGAGSFAVLPLAIVLGALASLVTSWLRRVERRLAAVLGGPPLPRAPRSLGAPVRGRAPRPRGAHGLRFGFARRPPPLALA